jgi:hypothetical protein
VRLRLLVACSCMPLAAIIVWAGGGTSLGVLLAVLIVFAFVVAYALVLESDAGEAAPPAAAAGTPVSEPPEGSVRMIRGARRVGAAVPPGAGEARAGGGPEPRRGETERPPAPGATAEGERPVEPEPSFEADFPPVAPFERPASLLAVIASRVGPQPGAPPLPQESRASAGGRWNVWALERLASERLSKESDYERSLLLVYLRDFASSDGTLPPEFNGFVESTFPDLIRELATDGG